MIIHITGSKKGSSEKQTSNVKKKKIKIKRQLLVQKCEARLFIKKHGRGLKFDFARDNVDEKIRVEQKKISVGEDTTSIQILDTKKERTNCPQGYEQKGRKDGF